MRLTLASFSFALLACSHDPLSSGAGSNPGTGTGTIVVNGTARASSQTPNANVDTSFTTQIDVQISINNAPITTGTVTVTSKTGSATLAYQQNGGPFGQWSGTIANYDPVYELNVTSGTDNIKGVFVEGPDLHVFTAPAEGATVDASMTINATWTHTETAQQAVFGVGDIQGLTIQDNGAYAIPALTLHTDNAAPRQNELHLTRSNSIVPKGAAAGSTFEVAVTQTVDVVANACATCP